MSKGILSIRDFLLFVRLDRRNLIPDKQGAEVVPFGPNDLYNMHQEKHDVEERQPEVKPSRHFIPAEQDRDDMKLSWFVDSDPGQQRTHAHQNDAGVGDLLGIVEFLLW